MSADPAKPVLIAGGGIGGLAAAVALARCGIRARVLEAEAAFSESGAGLQIGPNGSRILRSWGLGETLHGQAARPDGVLIRDGLSGKKLALVPLGAEAEKRYGTPYYVAERRVLHGMLLEEASRRTKVELLTGFRLAGLRQTPGGVTAIAADGRSEEGRSLIGADGVHSQVRSLLFAAAPAFSGRNAWRATAPDDDLSGENAGFVNLWLGPEAHLVHYRCGPPGSPLNAVAVTGGEAASPGWGAKRDPAELLAKFAGWAEEPQRILRKFSDWMAWPLLALPPLPRWGSGAITLLGDAAHPLMPFLASGAVMALEDASVLAAEIAHAPHDAAAAFRAYEQRRQSRARRVQHASARMGDIYHMSGPLRLARNLMLGALPAQSLLARNDWLYGYRNEGAESG